MTNSGPGVGASGTPVPMGTRVQAGTHRNFENFGTAGYRVPRKFWKLGTAGYRVPSKFLKLGTAGYRVPSKFHKNFWVPMGTGQSSAWDLIGISTKKNSYCAEVPAIGRF